MSEWPDAPKVMVVPGTDPLYAAYIWRQDSQTLAKLRPVLEQLRDIDDEECRFGDGCPVRGMSCLPCAIRRIKADLFGEATNEGTST